MEFSGERVKAVFAVEAGGLLRRMKQGLDVLRSGGGDDALLADMVRAAHTLRGSSTMMGYAAAAGEARLIEMSLDRARTGGIAMGPAQCDLLAERLRALGSAVERGEGAPGTVGGGALVRGGRRVRGEGGEGTMTKKVLIIEDSATDAAIVKELLEKEGIRVDVSVSGRDGVEKAVALKPDLIVLDILLPDISGFDVCARLKEKAALASAIVVMLSVKDNIEDITRAFHVGADDYIIKPPLPELLIRKIKLYLGLR